MLLRLGFEKQPPSGIQRPARSWPTGAHNSSARRNVENRIVKARSVARRDIAAILALSEQNHLTTLLRRNPSTASSWWSTKRVQSERSASNQSAYLYWFSVQKSHSWWFDSAAAPWLLGAGVVAAAGTGWFFTVGPGAGGGISRSRTRVSAGESEHVHAEAVEGVASDRRVTLSTVSRLMEEARFPAAGVSSLDFKNAMKHVLGKDAPHGEVLAAWFSMFDSDGDGRISGGEFLAVAAVLAAPDVAVAPSADAGAAQPLPKGCSEADVARLVFDAWDKNRNGVLTRAEVSSALRRLPITRSDMQVIMGLLFPPAESVPERILRLDMAQRTLAVRVLRSRLDMDTLQKRVFCDELLLSQLLQELVRESKL